MKTLHRNLWKTVYLKSTCSKKSYQTYHQFFKSSVFLMNTALHGIKSALRWKSQTVRLFFIGFQIKLQFLKNKDELNASFIGQQISGCIRAEQINEGLLADCKVASAVNWADAGNKTLLKQVATRLAQVASGFGKYFILSFKSLNLECIGELSLLPSSC